MAKLIGPLLSFSASKSIARTLAFSRTKGIKNAKAFSIPTDPGTPAQISQRSAMTTFVDLWTGGAIPAHMPTGWDLYCHITRKCYSGYHAYIRYANKFRNSYPSTFFAVTQTTVPPGRIRYSNAALAAINFPIDDGPTDVFAGPDPRSMTHRGTSTKVSFYYLTPTLGASAETVYVQLWRNGSPRSGIEVWTLA